MAGTLYPNFAGRQEGYMQSLAVETAGHRHQSYAVQLRKRRRQIETLQKRSIHTESAYSTAALSKCPDLPALPVTQQLAQLFALTNNPESALTGLTAARRLSSLSQAPPNMFLEYVPALIHFASAGALAFQTEASWLLCNIAAGDESCALTLVNNSIIPTCFNLLQSSCEEVVEHAIRCIANLGAHAVLADVKFVPMLLAIASQASIHLLPLVLVALGNLSKTPEECRTCLQLYKQLLQQPNKAVAVKALYAIRRVTLDGQTDAIVEAKVVPLVLAILNNKSAVVLKPALKVVGDVAASHYAAELFRYRVLDKLAGVIGHSDAEVRRDAHWILSNLCAGTPAQLQKVLQHSVTALAVQSLGDSALMVRREASFVFKNAAMLGAPLFQLFHEPLLGNLATLLASSKDSVLLLNALTVCKAVITQEDSRLSTLFVATGVYEALVRVSMSDDSSASTEASWILGEYFDNNDTEAWRQPVTEFVI